MNYKVFANIVTITLIVLAALFSCTKDKTPKPAPEVIPCDPNKVYFQTSILPLVNSNCAKSGCHDAITKQDGVNLSTYEGIRDEVKPGKPDDSDLIERINETDPSKIMPPPGTTTLTANQKNLLWNWVQQGADNSVCEQNAANCNPTNVSFANDVQPLLNTNCVGCHNDNSLGGGVNLSSHSGVQVVAQSGKLYNAVAHNGLATAMPQGQNKLPDCDIKKIKVWVDEGYKNN